MIRNKKIAVLVVLLMIVPSFMVCGYEKNDTKNAKPKKDLYDQLELFADAISLVRTDYVDDVDSKKLIYGAIRGMLSSLDDFSQFLEPEEFNEMKVETKGEFGGLGIEVGMRGGVLTVITPIAGTPAEAAGIEPDDLIVKIDDKSTKDLSLDESVKFMRGKPGSTITLTVWREKVNKIIEIPMKRAVITIHSVKNASIIEDKIGYIKLVEFQENTPRDLENALKRLESDGMEALVLDLRNNPGGLLDVAVDVAEKFIPKDKLIVSTKSRNPSQSTIFKSSGKYTHPDYPMVVLVNGGSASAAEIVAGAIQDDKRGILLGTKTFGKASVQEVVPLRDGSAARITTASYVTPSGRLIGGNGIVPDIVVEKAVCTNSEEKADKNKDVFDKAEDIKKPNGKDLKQPEDKDKVDIAADNQLERAVDLLKAMKLIRNGVVA